MKRDVTALQEAGVPVTGIGGPGGGYVLDAGASLPPITFTVGEAMAVAVAVATQADQPFAADGRRALTKLLGAVPPAALDQAETLAGRVWVRAAAPADGIGGGNARRVVEESVRTGTVVLLDYVDRNGATSIRRPVDPLGLAFDGSTWSLLAWCRLRDAGRWFRLDRITGAHATRQPVDRRDVATAFGVPPPDAGPVALH